MKKIPTTDEVFDIQSLGEDISDSLREEYLYHCLTECIDETLKPYEGLFDSNDFRFHEGEMELLLGPEASIFDEDEETAPTNSFMDCNSFMKIRGTKYEVLIDREHLIKPDDDAPDYFQPLGNELDYAEQHIDCNWTYYDDIDEDSYQRVVKCYQAAAEEHNHNALWCLGCALDLQGSHFFGQGMDDTFGLKYYYLTLAIQEGHIASIPSLCESMIHDGLDKVAFTLTYIGAQKKELYCMWNLSLYYLSGIIVPKSVERAKELYTSILEIIEGTDDKSKLFLQQNYDGINVEDLNELRDLTEKNLRIISSESTSWYKYFDIDVQKRLKRVRKQSMDELCKREEHSSDWYYARIKELMIHDDSM